MDLDAASRRTLLSSGKRKGGRPRGFKNKHQHSSSSVVVRKLEIPPRLNSLGNKDGQGDEQTITTTLPGGATVTLPKPRHPIFKCRWKSCRVELHNLATLRKHINRVHHPPEREIREHGFSCRWKNCRYLQADREDDGSVVTTRRFGTAEAWLEHINADHLLRVAMRLGDGPNSSCTDAQTLLRDKQRYLSDEQGAAVTPSVSRWRNADLPADALILTKPAAGDKPEAAAQKAFLLVHRPPSEKATPRTTAEETLRAMEARKARIGPGIERGGCTLVNEARRSTFLQNPRVRRVVSEDY